MDDNQLALGLAGLHHAMPFEHVLEAEYARGFRL